MSPRKGAITGGIILTVSGSGFSSNMTSTSVTIGSAPCDVVSANLTYITCRTSAQSAGTYGVEVGSLCNVTGVCDLSVT